MKTEQTENNGGPGWIFYDGGCGMCARAVEKYRARWLAHGYRCEQLQTPWVLTRLGLTEAQALEEMKVITKDGRVLGGAEAMCFVMQFIGWTKPAYWLSRVPGMLCLLRPLYRWLARHRHCWGGQCRRKGTP